MTRTLGPWLAALFLCSCGAELDSVPEGPNERPETRELEIPLDRISLLLAAELGDTDMLAELYRSSGEIRWNDDGALAVRVGATRGHPEVVSMLLGYGACMDFAPACYEALERAIQRGHVGVALQLEAALRRPAHEGREHGA